MQVNEMRRFLAILILAAGAAQAEVPAVVTDIAPVHSLTALVMQGVGTPELLLGPATDPHHVQMRPSQARLMAGADLVIWTGEALTPWLADVIETLAADADTVELLALNDLPLRIEGAVAFLHSPADKEPGDQDEPSSNETSDHSGEEDTDQHDHSHGALDPHVWLDPQNAIRFLEEIATALARTDAENGETYRQNAARAAKRIQALDAIIAEQMTIRRATTLLTYHDAYRYFFVRYNLRLSRSLVPVDGTPPGAAHLAEIKSLLAGSDRVCVFSEPGANDKLIATVLPDQNHPVTHLDPLGSTLTPGPALYIDLITNLAAMIAICDS